MAMQAMLWSAAGSCVIGAAGAAWREQRRGRRRDLDAVSMVDWRTVQFAAIVGAILLAALALHQ